MSFLEKLNIVKSNSNKFKTHIFNMGSVISLNEINAMKLTYPFLPHDYELFLQEVDGARVSWCTFIGSQRLSEILPLWAELIGEDYLPIAKNAQGDLFTINSKGAVIMFDAHTEEPEFIASSFEKFISDCVLGKRYGEFAYTENNPFYNFLKEQGWVSDAAEVN